MANQRQRNDPPARGASFPIARRSGEAQLGGKCFNGLPQLRANQAPSCRGICGLRGAARVSRV